MREGGVRCGGLLYSDQIFICNIGSAYFAALYVIKWKVKMKSPRAAEEHSEYVFWRATNNIDVDVEVSSWKRWRCGCRSGVRFIV